MYGLDAQGRDRPAKGGNKKWSGDCYETGLVELGDLESQGGVI